MNFAYGVIIIVGVLAAITIGFIAVSPDDVVKPRVIAVEQISVNSHIMPETASVGDVLLIEVEFRDDDENIVDHVNYDISATQDEEVILSEPGSHRHPGKHPIHETTVLSESPVEIQVIIQGLGHGDEITEPKGIESSITVVPETNSESVPPTSAMPAPPVTFTVEIPAGSGAPGCDETNECFLPHSLEVQVGDTVIWNNVDSAAHTVTSGIVPEHDGLFDSSIFMSGSTFEVTFDDVGTFDYYCMVHPWMIGVIIVDKVEEMVVVPEPISESEPIVVESVTESTTEIMSSSLAISIPNGVGVPGCDETNECYSPYDVTVPVGGTVIWSNDDTAVHTVTSGTIDAGLTGVFDSGLFVSGSTFEFTFDKSGIFDYFCLVHPWMTGIINVN